jgi:hypothetical protein
MKFCHSQVNVWNWRTSSYKKLSSKGRKSHSPSYEDYRPETNAVILSDMGHTLRGEHVLEEKGKGRRPKT